MSGNGKNGKELFKVINKNNEMGIQRKNVKAEYQGEFPASGCFQWFLVVF